MFDTLFCLFSSVAKQVTTRGHTVGGKVLEVTLYTPPPVVEDKGQCTLEVRGFDPQNLELYQLYFENPRKVAGTVTNFQVSEDNDVIYITFQTPEGKIYISFSANVIICAFVLSWLLI